MAPLMPSVVVMNYSWEAELGEGREPPLTIDGDLCRIYEGIPFATGTVTCYGSLFGTVTVRQADHGYEREELNNVTVAVDGTTGATTDSTGGYQISSVPVSAVLVATRPMTFTKTGDFFTGVVSPTVTCGDETMQNFELICSNTLSVTTFYSRSIDAALSLLPTTEVTAVVTYNIGDPPIATETKTDKGTTNNAGYLSLTVAGGTVVGTASKVGYDPAACFETQVSEGAVCVDTTALPWMTCELCTWNSIVGTLTVGTQPAAGYRVDAVRTDTWVVVDSDTSTATGVFSVDNLSKLLPGAYDLRLYNPSGTLVSTRPGVAITTCGATGVITYTDGTWTGPTFP